MWLTNRRVLGVGALLAIVVAVGVHNVPTRVTVEDTTFADLILKRAGYLPEQLRLGRSREFETEIEVIRAVQDSVLKIAPEDKGIPLKSEREPKDLVEHGYGLCYDRSRSIEKLLSWLGLQARHVSVYSRGRGSSLSVLLRPGTNSHAVSEVFTTKGWMLVDSNARWIGLDANRNPVSLSDLQADPSRIWASDNRDPINKIFTKPFLHIRGLYSRHGSFYPPFTPVPDFNLIEVLGNLSG